MAHRCTTRDRRGVASELDMRATLWVTLALVGCAAIVFIPLVPWIVLALWTAKLMSGAHAALSRTLGGHPRIAALMAVTLLVILIVPVVILITVLIADAIALLRQSSTSDAQETLQRLVAGDRAEARPDFVGLMMNQAERLWALARQIAGTAAHVVIGLAILIIGTYAFLTEGARWFHWIERHVPLPAPVLRRFATAFDETGHGLFVGIVGAGVVQSAIATVVYLALGVPQPFALGLLTLGASVIPVVGTSLVWLPVAAGLALTGRTASAAILVITGVAVIGTIDNFIRPYLARRGHLQLPTYVVLLAMFGGIAVMGGWGLLMGPLIVRLAKEGLMLARRPDPLATDRKPDRSRPGGHRARQPRGRNSRGTGRPSANFG